MLIHIFTIYVFVHVFVDVFVQSLGVAYSMSGARMRAAVEWRQTSEPGRPTIHQPVRNRTTLHTHLRTSLFFSEIVFVFVFFCISAFLDPPITIPLLSIYRRLHTSFLFSCVQMF